MKEFEVPIMCSRCGPECKFNSLAELIYSFSLKVLWILSEVSIFKLKNTLGVKKLEP